MQQNYYPQIKETFYKHFKGLDDPKYLDNERNYKIKAAEKAWDILSKETFDGYLENEDYQAIIDKLKKSVLQLI